MEQMFNYGQIFHFAQVKWQQNGRIPADQIKAWRDTIPAEMFSAARYSGTMSNHMALDIPGHNWEPHARQLRNQRKAQPTESYLYRFPELMDQLGIQRVYFTVNIHKAYLEGNQWVDRMFAAFEYIRANCNVVGVELGNECNMEAAITGSSGGTPTIFDRVKYLGLENAEEAISRRVNRYLDFLEQYAGYFKPIPVSVTVARPGTLRDNVWNREVLKRKFYDAVSAHIYLTTQTPEETFTAVRQWLTPFLNRRIWVSEWNYNYALEPRPAGIFHNTNRAGGYRDANIRAFRECNVEMCAFHTLWAGDANINNFIPIA